MMVYDYQCRRCQNTGCDLSWKNPESQWMNCTNFIAPPETNADCIRNMTDEEIEKWYWWMLHYVQGYTDSRVALREWLKQDYTTFVAQEYKKDLVDRLNREGISP